MTHFLEVDDLDPAQLAAVLDRARRWKRDPTQVPHVLAGRGVALLFEKPSARTRISTEMAVVDARRPPDLHPGAKRSASASASGRGRRPNARRLLRGHRGPGVRPRDARVDGRGRRRPGRQPAVGSRPSRARRWPTSSRCASSSAPLEGRRARLRGRRQQRRRVARVRVPRSRASSSRSRRRPGYELDEDVVDRARNLGGVVELVDRPVRGREGRRRRLHRRVDVDGPGGRGRAAPGRVRGYRSTPTLMDAAGPQARVPALPARRTAARRSPPR